MNLKRIDATNLRSYNGVHIELPLGIINIYTKLADLKGRRVNTYEIILSNYSGENKVIQKGNRLIETNNRND